MLIMIGINIQVTCNVTTCAHRGFLLKANTIFFFLDWMLAGQHSFTAGGRIRKVGLDEICRWISDAWDDIPSEMIAKSFRKCCFTNALDGTEDEERRRIHLKILMK